MSIYVDDKLVTFTKYPNGETVMPVLNSPEPLFRQPVVRLHWESDDDLVKLALVRGQLNQVAHDTETDDLKPILTIDYLPYSRMDRAQDGRGCSLLYIANLINAMDWDKVFVVEPHSHVASLLIKKMTPIYPTVLLLPKVKQMVNFKGRDYIVFPDAGAAKRYTDLIDLSNDNLIVLKKKRDFETGKIQGLEVDYTLRRGANEQFSGEIFNALIVDDLSSRGGTFVQAADILRDVVGCEKVSLLVTHMESVGLTGDLPKKLDRVFCTDTMTLPRPLPGNFELFQRSDWL